MTGAVAAVAIALQLVNVNSHGVQGDGHSIWADVSRDGRLVVFDSFARNLSSRSLERPDDQEVYLRNRRSGRTRMVSLNSRGRVSNAWSWMPSLSPNGRYVAFCSTASNLVRPDRRPRVPHTGPGLDPHTDVFVRDLRRGVTRRASSDRRGRMANAGSCFPSVADNGDVAFVSEATDLARGYRNRFIETFVWDWSSRRVRAVAAAPGGRSGPGSEGAAISPDGRYVEFYTGGRLAASDTDVLGDAYLYDRRRGSAQVVSPGPLDCLHGGILGLTPHARHVLHWCGDMVRVLDRRSGRVVNATPTLDGRPPKRAPARARPTCPPTGGRRSSPPTCRGWCRTTCATCARATPSSRRCADSARPGQRRHVADPGLLAQHPLGIDRWGQCPRSSRARSSAVSSNPSAPSAPWM
jgi:hypothetical protein